MTKTWTAVLDNYRSFEQGGTSRPDALSRATRRAIDKGAHIVSFEYRRMRPHRGISGFGYCVVCGLKPGNTRFNPSDCAGRWDA